MSEKDGGKNTAKGTRLYKRDVRYGYRLSDDRTRLVPDPETAPAVREMYALSAAGMGTEEIAARMAAEGRVPPMKFRMDAFGCADEGEHGWLPEAVRHILLNPVYSGSRARIARGREGVLEAEPLASREEFEAAARRLTSPDTAERHKALPDENPLFGKVVDAETGERLALAEAPGGGRRFVPRRDAGKEGARGIPYGDVEGRVLERIREEGRLAEKAAAHRDGFGAALERGLAALREEGMALFRETAALLARGWENAPEGDALAGVMRRQKELRTAFSDGNPWLMAFLGTEPGERLTAPVARRCVEEVRVRDLGEIAVAMAQEKWKRMLPEEWTKE